MDEELKALITALGESLRSDMAASLAKLDAKCDALAESISKKKADNDDDDMAQRVAADRQARSDSVDPAAFASLASSVAELKQRQSRPMSDLNAFADAQAKADSVMRVHGSAAEPPMAGEDLIAYQIRMARKMQKHSPKWKGVDLGIISAARQAFENVLTEIRADAVHAGLNPTDLQLFEHRKFVKQTPGGHTITEFVGNGTIFKKMSRPVRHIAYIGTRTGIGG
jgi:hypothetical protein